MESRTEKKNGLKQELIRSSHRHKAKFVDELDHLNDQLKSVGGKALLISGGLFITYQLVKLMLSDEEEEDKESKKDKAEAEEPKKQIGKAAFLPYKKHQPPSRMGQLKSQLTKQAILFILGQFRERLTLYIENNQTNENQKSIQKLTTKK